MIAFIVASTLILPQETTEPVYYSDTSELLGVVALWPRENVLVFENQFVRFDWDAIESIEKWSNTHVIVSDVFGETYVIDIRKVPKTDRSMWDEAGPSITEAEGFIEIGRLLPNDEVLGRNEGSPEKVLHGIGAATAANRFYSRSYDAGKDLTIVSNAVVTPSESPHDRVVIALEGWCYPVFIRDEEHYVFMRLGEEYESRLNSVFVYNRGQSRKVFGPALEFLPLRTRKP